MENMNKCIQCTVEQQKINAQTAFHSVQRVKLSDKIGQIETSARFYFYWYKTVIDKLLKKLYNLYCSIKNNATIYPSVKKQSKACFCTKKSIYFQCFSPDNY